MELTIIRDLKNYDTQSFIGDLISGLMVAIVLIPQGLAYSILAGMPPVYGLYASLVPLVVYSVFASSRYLSVGPVAIMSIVILAGVSSFARPGTMEYIEMVLLVGLISGVFQIIFALLKLGTLSNFLSKPVMNGFIAAAGIIIIISQLKHLLSLEYGGSGSVTQILSGFIQHLSEYNVYSGALGLGAILLLIIMRIWAPKCPYYLIVVVLGTLILYFNKETLTSVPIVGNIPAHFPIFSTEFFVPNRVLDLIPTALVVSIICFIGSFSISKALADSSSDSNQKISANRELLGLGMAKLVGSFFLAMPSTGSFTRSAINREAGARTSLSGFFTAGIIALVLGLMSTLFYYLPLPILAAIVIVSVLGLINVAEVRKLFDQDRTDFWVYMATFFLTLFLGIVNGIIAGILLSLLSVIIRASKPHFAELGNLPGTASYRNIDRYKDAYVEDKILILRYDQDLFFGNAEHFYRSIVGRIESRMPLEKLILHVGGVNNIDSTAMMKLIELNNYCLKNQIRLELTNVSGPVRDRIYKSDFYKCLGKDRLHLSVAHAILGEDHDQVKKKNLSLKYSYQSDINKIE